MFYFCEDITYLHILYILCLLDLTSNAMIVIIIFLPWRCEPTRVMASSFLRFLDNTQGRTTVGRTPPDELSARRRDLCLTTHNTQNRQTSMPPVGFEPTISAGERPGRVISSSQRPLPDNTRHSQQTNIHAPGGIRTQDLSRRAAAGGIWKPN